MTDVQVIHNEINKLINKKLLKKDVELGRSFMDLSDFYKPDSTIGDTANRILKICTKVNEKNTIVFEDICSTGGNCKGI